VNVRLVHFLVLAMAMPVTAEAQMITAQGVIIEATPIRIEPTARVPLTTLPRGTDVTVVNVQDAWVQVAFEDLRYGRRVGYVPRATVSFAMPGAPSAARVESPKSLWQPASAPPAPAPAPAATRAATPVAAAAAPAPDVPAEKPPVRLVESAFPAVAAAPSRVKSSEAGSTPRSVVSIGNAFPDLTPGALTAPANVAETSTRATPPSGPPVVLPAEPTVVMATGPSAVPS
jgi:hypothetical protein